MQENVAPKSAASKEEILRSPIITPVDQERFPLLEHSSRFCDLPLPAEDREQLLYMEALLEGLGNSALGLAAVQIGWPKRIFMLRHPNTGTITTYVNPSVVAISPETSRKPEACLSLPDYSVRVSRPKRVTLSYFTPEGDKEQETFIGVRAKAVMHEIDHLNGMLITRYAEQDIRNRVNASINKASARENMVAARRKQRKAAKKSQKRNR